MRCPTLDEQMLTLAGEFRPVEEGRAREQLDDFSRLLFGVGALHALGLRRVLRGEHGASNRQPSAAGPPAAGPLISNRKRPALAQTPA